MSTDESEVERHGRGLTWFPSANRLKRMRGRTTALLVLCRYFGHTTESSRHERFPRWWRVLLRLRGRTIKSDQFSETQSLILAIHKVLTGW